MKTAIIIVEGTTQIALTPDNEWERRVLEQVQKHHGGLSILSGRVYECQGGYWRAVDMGTERTRESLILRLDEPVPSGARPSAGDPQ